MLTILREEERQRKERSRVQVSSDAGIKCLIKGEEIAEMHMSATKRTFEFKGLVFSE